MNATACLELALPASPSSVPIARSRVAAVASQAGAADDVVEDIRLCVNEAVANAVVHGYAGGPGVVTVAVFRDDAKLQVHVRDEGRGFEARLGGYEPDGLGLAVMEWLATNFSIRSSPGEGTELVLSFELESDPA